MSLYSIALFLHVTGAVLLFAAITVEGIALRLLRRAQTAEEARSAAQLLQLNRLVGPVSAVGVLIPGLYMTATTWGWVAWILVALAAWALIAVFGAINGMRIVALARSLATESGAIGPKVRARIGDTALVVSYFARVGLALGVVFLMTVKPGIAESVMAIVVAAAAGVAAGSAISNRGPSHEKQAAPDRAA
jgi:hypothetical protein